MNGVHTIAGSERDDARARSIRGELPLTWPDQVVVINDISAMRGGATGVALASVGHLQGMGLPVTFITGDDASEADPQLADAIEAIGGRHVLEGSRTGAMVRGLYNRAAARHLSNWIARRDTPATIYHLHGWSKILSPSIFGALKPVAERLVLHAHDFFLSCPNGGYFNFREERPCTLTPLGAKCLACHCDRRSYAQKVWRVGRLAMCHRFLDLRATGGVLAVHEAMVPLLRNGRFGGMAIDVLRNPVVPWCEERIAAERNRTFLFVGRLDVDKGVDLLAAAARRAGVRLRMIGTGPLAKKLEREFPDFEFTGWKDREDIRELCQDTRAIVMPTRSRETFGLAVLEALMSGLPAIVSSHALLAPEIVKGGFGFSCDPHDEVRLARLLSCLAGDDAGVAQMSEAGHLHARALAPTPLEWSECLLTFYSAVLDAANAPNDDRLRRRGKQLPVT